MMHMMTSPTTMLPILLCSSVPTAAGRGPRAPVGQVSRWQWRVALGIKQQQGGQLAG